MPFTRPRVISALLSLALVACASSLSAPAGGDYLYVWSGDTDGADPDFLAVLDARPGSSHYGEVIKTVPVPGRAGWPHHIEHELTPGRSLFANAWNTGQTFVFDMSTPDTPLLKKTFGEVGGYAFPHSYARLPNGNVLATFQSVAGDYAPPGALVELDNDGRVIRAVTGSAPGIKTNDTWPYSLLVMPDIDRVVMTNTRMGTIPEWTGTAKEHGGHGHVGRDNRPTHVQIFRLSDLTLLATLQLPQQQGGHNELPAEARRLANGAVYVNTFTCGLYRIAGVETMHPTVHPVLYSPQEGYKFCAVPVVLGNFWIQPSSTENAVVAYDLSDASRVREVSRISLQVPPFTEVHYLSLDPSAPRIVVTADNWVMLLNIDPATGHLSIDERFRDPGSVRPGVMFSSRQEWPHGATGGAMAHGAVFSVRAGARTAVR